MRRYPQTDDGEEADVHLIEPAADTSPHGKRVRARMHSPDAMAFRIWLRTAKAGEAYIYYVGHLAEDRMELTATPNGFQYYVARQPLNDYALTVWDAYEDGKVELVQRRLRGGVPRYEYIAIKRRRVPQNRRHDG